MNLDDVGNQVVHLVGNSTQLTAMEQFMISTLAPYEDGRALPASSVTVVPASASLQTLNQMQNGVSNDWAQLRQDGVGIESWGVDITNNALDVTVHDLASSDTSVLQSLLGSNNLEVESDTGTEAPLYNRTTDTPPWFGGDVIDESGNCTSGFPVSESNVTFNVTAGHCGNGSFTQNGNGYGETYQITYCHNCKGDFQTITTYPESATGDVYTGAVNAATAEEVGGVGLSQETGEEACFDGYAFQADIGGGTVNCNKIKEFNDCVTPFAEGGGTSYRTCGLTKAGSTAGELFAEMGDSGGPVYNYFPTTLQALGIINAGADCTLDVHAIYACDIGYFTPEGLIQYDDGADTICGSSAC